MVMRGWDQHADAESVEIVRRLNFRIVWARGNDFCHIYKYWPNTADPESYSLCGTHRKHWNYFYDSKKTGVSECADCKARIMQELLEGDPEW